MNTGSYIYKKGDGKDTIIDASGTKDMIKLQDLTLSELGFTKQGNHLSITIKNSNDGIMIENYFKQSATSFLNPLSAINPIAYHNKISNSINGANIIEHIVLDNAILHYQEVSKLINRQYPMHL